MTSFDNVAEIYDATRGMPPEIAAEVTAGLLSVVTPRKARFSHKLAIAPTASISIICGGASPWQAWQ